MHSTDVKGMQGRTILIILAALLAVGCKQRVGDGVTKAPAALRLSPSWPCDRRIVFPDVDVSQSGRHAFRVASAPKDWYSVAFVFDDLRVAQSLREGRITVRLRDPSGSDLLERTRYNWLEVESVGDPPGRFERYLMPKLSLDPSSDYTLEVEVLVPIAPGDSVIVKPVLSSPRAFWGEREGPHGIITPTKPVRTPAGG